MPAAILFDLDGTLWDRTAAVRALATAQHDDLHALLGQIPRADYVDRIIRLDDNGRTDKTMLYHTVGVEFGLSEDVVAHLHADFWTRLATFVHPFPEVIDTLTHLRRAGVKLGIITNGSIRVQEDKITRLGLSGLMDVVLISEREGVRKPEAEIFHRALERLGVSAHDAWFVGDSPDADVAGALAAGLRPFWRECRDWPPPAVACETIRSLDALLPLLT
ncbi:MAG TPA: HAD family hydrolase [Vicinamibacterales bacterium]|jgi:putative hydrolase of the HAD superfamily